MLYLNFANPYDRVLDTKNNEKEIVLRHGHIALTNYTPGDNIEFERLLSVWDPLYFRAHQVTGLYIDELKEYRIGRGFRLKKLEQLFPNRRIRIDNEHNDVRKHQYELTTPPRDDFQRVAITSMAAQGPYRSHARYTQHLLTADPGSGKTYCGVAVSAYFNARVAIFCPISKIMNQWKESYVNFTTLKEEDILIVKGSNMCEKIRQGKYSDKVIFIFSNDTVVSYVQLYGERAAIEMMNATGAYMKIIDEIHKDIKAVGVIEGVCNFMMNYYMSASPTRTERKEKFIFDMLYKGIPTFGKDFKHESTKHINIIVKKYIFTPSDSQIREMYKPNIGLNSSRYEKVLIESRDNQKKSFVDALTTMLHWSKDMVKKDNKILILCKTKLGTEFVEQIAGAIFKPSQCSHYYSSGMSEKQREEALSAKVICATSSSMGTGADIKGLQHVINICTYSNPIDATQLPGRARKLKDGTPVVYIELVNMGYRKTVGQYQRRAGYLSENAANGKIMVIG